MKVGCPGCGQHYDIDVNNIEHFFHCTECGIFFRGINAKPVIPQKFKHKKKTQALEDVGTALPNGTQDVKYSEDSQINPEDAVFEEWDEDEDTERNRPESLALPPWTKPWIAAGGIMAGIAVILILVVQALQISTMRTQISRANTEINILHQELDLAKDKINEIDTLKGLLTSTAFLSDEAKEKIGVADLNAALLALDDRVADLTKAFGSSRPEVLALMDERLRTVEKQSANWETQSKMTAGYFSELMKLVGSTKNRTITRSMLERLDYLEAALSRDLSASAVPRVSPRIPVYLRLTALEVLVAGGSDEMQTVPNYTTGIIGQLEALKTQVNQLKWALGK